MGWSRARVLVIVPSKSLPFGVKSCLNAVGWVERMLYRQMINLVGQFEVSKLIPTVPVLRSVRIGVRVLSQVVF